MSNKERLRLARKVLKAHVALGSAFISYDDMDSDAAVYKAEIDKCWEQTTNVLRVMGYEVVGFTSDRPSLKPLAGSFSL